MREKPGVASHAAQRVPEAGVRCAADFLQEGRERERAGAVGEALAAYESAISAAKRSGEHNLVAESLRRLGVAHHHRGERAVARELCERSRQVAVGIGDSILAGEAQNALAGFEFEAGNIDAARDRFRDALALGGESPGLRGRIEQNLGILANIQGALGDATAHYERSLDAFRRSGDERGCAIAYHNLGMASADRGRWDQAEEYYRRTLEVASRIGDRHLEGLARLNRSEVLLARQRYDDARAGAEAALEIFNQLGARLDKADAYKLIGRVYRETGRWALAESRLKGAIDLAVSNGSVLSEAEASRELALLYQAMGRNQDALGLLNAAHRLFTRLDARVDLVDVAGKVHRLEETYFAVVRDWGQSIESADSYTFGHCERVANYAVAVAQALKLDDQQLTTIRLGAYLHDLGKVRVPHEILNKPGKLTTEEFGVIQMHPVWGVELLVSVDFPWDIKPIIRWHHEKHDGTGYPDRLHGDQIPIGPQIIGIVDVFDALTTTRSYRPALTESEAVARIVESRTAWRDNVYDSFMCSVGRAS